MVREMQQLTLATVNLDKPRKQTRRTVSLAKLDRAAMV